MGGQVGGIPKKVCYMSVVTKIRFSGNFWPKKRALTPPRRPPCKAVNTKRLSFRCPVMMVTIFLRLFTKKLFQAKKTAFLGPKKATLGNRGHETARRAAKRPPSEKPKLSRVTSGYGEDMIPLSWIRLTPKNGGYMGVALKNADFRLKYAKIACSSKLLKVSAVGRQLINSVLVPD